jgi:hypothetical protein
MTLYLGIGRGPWGEEAIAANGLYQGCRIAGCGRRDDGMHLLGRDRT